MRLGLAIRAFFAVLFHKPIPFELLFDDEPQELPAPPPPVVEVLAEPPKLEAPPPPAKPDPKLLDAAAVRVLAVLQSEGRLLDFLSEAIDGYSDEEVGAAVRDVHKGLSRGIAEHFPLEPLRTEAEESKVKIEAGFDPHAVRLVGNVVGEPPFRGVLKHRGWRVRSVKLPRLPEGEAALIAAPAEVEL